MTLSLNQLAELYHNTYEAAARKNGWYDPSRKQLMWWEIPHDNRVAMLEAIAIVEDVVRKDEREKYASDTMQTDLTQITQALNIHSYEPTFTPHQVIQALVIPKIRKMKKQLSDIQAAVMELRRVTDIT